MAALITPELGKRLGRRGKPKLANSRLPLGSFHVSTEVGSIVELAWAATGKTNAKARTREMKRLVIKPPRVLSKKYAPRDSNPEPAD